MTTDLAPEHRDTTAPARVAARVTDLVKTYGSRSSLAFIKGVSLDLNRGEFTAIMGPSGYLANPTSCTAPPVSTR